MAQTRQPRLTLALLMAGAFCCPMSTWTLFKGYLSLGDAFFLAALGTYASTALRRLNQVGGVPITLLASGALFALSGMITFALGGPGSEPINAAKMVFSLCVFPILIVLVAGTDLREVEKLLLAWLAGGVFSAAVAVANYNGVSLLGFYGVEVAGRVSGLAYHPNALGYTCALLVPVAAYLWWRATAWWHSALLLAGLCVLLYALHLSGSRASLVALLLGVAYPIARLVRFEAWAYVLLGVVGLAFAGLLGATLVSELDLHDLAHRVEESAIGRLLGLSSSAEQSDSERWASIHYSWAQFQESPLFGAGYGWLRTAHMHLLGIMHCGGLFGLSALLLWFIALAAADHRIASAQRRHAGGRIGLRGVVIAGMVIWFVNGALQPVLLDRNGYILAGVLFALDAHARRKLSGIPRQTVSREGMSTPQPM